MGRWLSEFLENELYIHSDISDKGDKTPLNLQNMSPVSPLSPCHQEDIQEKDSFITQPQSIAHMKRVTLSSGQTLDLLCYITFYNERAAMYKDEMEHVDAEWKAMNDTILHYCDTHAVLTTGPIVYEITTILCQHVEIHL
jgi:hypothetical protein